MQPVRRNRVTHVYGYSKKGTSEMSIREMWKIAKTITIGDVIGAISLFGLLFVGLFFVMVFQ